MTTSVLQNGTQVAAELHDSSAFSKPEPHNLTTLGELLNILGKNPPPEFPMLRTTCSLIAVYLHKPTEQITVDSVNESRDGFRTYLVSRKHKKYKENSIRTYVNHLSILLKNARDLGWEPSEAVPEEWHAVLDLAAEKQCGDVVKFVARIGKKPRDVTAGDVDSWAQLSIQRGGSHGWVTYKKNRFWRILHDCGYTDHTPIRILRGDPYGVPLEQFPLALKKEVVELLRWKRAEFSLNRPNGGRHREVSSSNLRIIICAIYGFVVNVCGETEIVSLPQLFEKRIICRYAEWSINERKLKGYCLKNALGMFFAAMHQHPSYSSMDFSWFKPLQDSLPTESRKERRKRKAEKCLQYDVVANIAAKIHAERPAAKERGNYHLALLAMEELIMKWLTILPWRQRNLRECRINGPKPNLFKGKIPPFSDIDKPEWVKEEEKKNPEGEFWQFRFSDIETKTGIDVHALLPRQLIGPVEEYLREFRPHLLRGTDPGTLCVNQAGKPMQANAVQRLVSSLTLRHGGRSVHPHLFRDIVAFTWLKAHPRDYLTLSKMLWHSNINTTIQIYGSEFNESSGVCAMESWLEEREAKSC